MAELIGIKGFVQNQPDGSVYCEAEGEEEILTKFVQWCQHGPEHAEVKYVSVHEGEVLNFVEFVVKR